MKGKSGSDSKGKKKCTKIKRKKERKKERKWHFLRRKGELSSIEDKEVLSE